MCNLILFCLNSSDFPQMSFQFSQFFMLSFFLKTALVTQTWVFEIFPKFSTFCLHWKLPAPISRSFSWNNDCRFSNNSPKTITRKRLFFWRHLRKVRFFLIFRFASCSFLSQFLSHFNLWLFPYFSSFFFARPFSFVERDKNDLIKRIMLYGSEVFRI